MGRRPMDVTIGRDGRAAINAGDPIGVQLHAIQRVRSREARHPDDPRLTQAYLAAELDVATETVRRALGKVDADRGAPGPVSFAVAHRLGVRPAYVALTLARDEIRRQWMGMRPTQAELIERYQAIERELGVALEGMSPFVNES